MVYLTKLQAMKYRQAILKIIDNLDDETAIETPLLFPKWQVGKQYSIDDRVNHNGVLYKCLQSHNAQNDWTPDVAVSLWVRVDDPAIEWPEWVQPLGAQDAYAKGAKVSHNNLHWISDVDNNVWEPGVYGWTQQ